MKASAVYGGSSPDRESPPISDHPVESMDFMSTQRTSTMGCYIILYDDKHQISKISYSSLYLDKGSKYVQIDPHFPHLGTCAHIWSYDIEYIRSLYTYIYNVLSMVKMIVMWHRLTSIIHECQEVTCLYGSAQGLQSLSVLQQTPTKLSLEMWGFLGAFGWIISPIRLYLSLSFNVEESIPLSHFQPSDSGTLWNCSAAMS